jgi:5,10-methylenetetrahydromethanopterin reductase
MVKFSLALEGDKAPEDYRRLAKLIEKHGFYSLQLYDHLPFRPAWGLSFSLAGYLRRVKIGPVTIPAYLYSPEEAARNLALLGELSCAGAVLGISRGAYHELLGRRVERSRAALLRFLSRLHGMLAPSGRPKLGWLRPGSYELYVGTSGPKLASQVARLPFVSAVVVDNLWNPAYASKLKGILSEAAKEAGLERPPLLIARPFCCVDEDREGASARAIEELSRYLPRLAGGSPMLLEGGLSPAALTNEQELRRQLAKRYLNFAAAGTVDEIIAQTESMIRAGVDHICYGHPLGREPEKAVVALALKVKGYLEERYPD